MYNHILTRSLIFMKNYHMKNKELMMNKKAAAITLCILIFARLTFGADYQPKNRPNFPQNRTGLSYKVGDTSVTTRSDGSSSRTRPFGSGHMTTETTADGKKITGYTTKSSGGTRTQWSDGSTTYSRPFGNGSIVTETSKGRTTTGIVTPYKNGSVTRWNNGSTNTNRNFGNGSVNTDRK